MSDWHTIYKCARKFPLSLFMALLLALSSVIVNGLSMTLMAPLLLAMFGQQADFTGAPRLFSQLMLLLPQNNPLYLGGLVVLLMAVKSLLAWLSTAASFDLCRRCIDDLREQVLSLVMHADLSYFHRNNPGQLVTHVWQEVDHTAKSLVAANDLLVAILTVAMYVLIMITLSPLLAVVTLLVFALVFAVNHAEFRRTKVLGAKALAKAQKMGSSLFEVFSAIKLVKSCTAEEREAAELSTISRHYTEADFAANTTMGAIAPLTEFTGMAALVGIVLVGRSLLPPSPHGFSVSLVTFLFLLFRTISYTGLINNRNATLARYNPSADSLSKFLSMSNSSSLKNTGTIEYTDLKSGIRFDNVSFAYEPNSEQVLQSVNLFVPTGSVLAVVGESGAGKSTLADLLCRYYSPSSGMITLDDTNISDFNVQSLRRKIAAVGQDAFLFNNTIRYNIAYGRPSASEAQIIEAARQAHVWEFIEKLPKGIDSIVGERGALLSTGQRQRIAIARVILQDPDVLVLDEATNALDTISEHIVQTALESLMRNRTTIIIAHRLAIAQKADQIAVLQNGYVIEIGSHEQLRAMKGLYHRMCEKGSILAIRSTGDGGGVSADELE